MQLRICAEMKLRSVRHSSDSLLMFSTRSSTVLKNGRCTELKNKDSWSSDGHLNNITNKQAGKYRRFILSNRYSFKTCEKLTQWARAKNIMFETMWLFSNSTDLVHPCAPHHVGAPWEMENSGKKNFWYTLGCEIHPDD